MFAIPSPSMPEEGYSIRTVQKLLGHRDVSTTMIYTHVLNQGGVRDSKARLIDSDVVRAVRCRKVE